MTENDNERPYKAEAECLHTQKMEHPSEDWIFLPKSIQKSTGKLLPLPAILINNIINNIHSVWILSLWLHEPVEYSKILSCSISPALCDSMSGKEQ